MYCPNEDTYTVNLFFIAPQGLKSFWHLWTVVWWRTTSTGRPQRPSYVIPSLKTFPMNDKYASRSKIIWTEPGRGDERKVRDTHWRVDVLMVYSFSPNRHSDLDWRGPRIFCRFNVISGYAFFHFPTSGIFTDAWNYSVIKSSFNELQCWPHLSKVLFCGQS